MVPSPLRVINDPLVWKRSYSKLLVLHSLCLLYGCAMPSVRLSYNLKVVDGGDPSGR